MMLSLVIVDFKEVQYSQTLTITILQLRSRFRQNMLYLILWSSLP